MDMIEKKITVKDYLTKSSLPASDYVGGHYPDLVQEYERIYIRKDNT